jgi:hypothetical protein
VAPVEPALGRGPVASAEFTLVASPDDRIPENATGAGAPPTTWHGTELAVGVLHKAAHGFVTGAVTDALAAGTAPGRHADAGPLPCEDGYGR